MVKVSIIVPVHNAGIYLERCLDTLINQTLQEIEILLVLDCPTDGSDVVAKRYASKDSRIKIIENAENMHIGLSRNAGIDEAIGEYIGFSDHDDYRELNMYENLYNSAKKNDSDIVLSAFGSDTHGVVTKIYYPENLNLELQRKLVIGGYDINNEWSYFAQNGGMWNKIYRRELIGDDIRFVDNRKATYEDLLFLIEVSLKAKSISVVNEVYYYHAEDIDNASSKYFFNDVNLVKNYLGKVYQILKENQVYEYYKLDFYKSVVNMVLVSANNELKSTNPFSNKLKNLSVFKKEPYVKEAFKKLSLSDIIYPPTSKKSKYFRIALFNFYKF